MMLNADCYLPGQVTVAEDGAVTLDYEGTTIPIRDPDGVVPADVDGEERTLGVDFGAVVSARICEDGPGVDVTDAGIFLRGGRATFQDESYPRRERVNPKPTDVIRTLEPGYVPGGSGVAQLLVADVTASTLLPLSADPIHSELFDDVALSACPSGAGGFKRDPSEWCLHLGVGDVPLFGERGWIDCDITRLAKQLATAVIERNEGLVGPSDCKLKLSWDDDVATVKLVAAPIQVELFPPEGLRVERAALAQAVYRLGIQLTDAIPTDAGEDSETLTQRLGELAEAVPIETAIPDPLATARARRREDDDTSPASLLDDLATLARTDPAHRVAAIAELGRLGDERASEALTNLFESGELAIHERYAVARALAACGAPRVEGAKSDDADSDDADGGEPTRPDLWGINYSRPVTPADLPPVDRLGYLVRAYELDALDGDSDDREHVMNALRIHGLQIADQPTDLGDTIDGKRFLPLSAVFEAARTDPEIAVRRRAAMTLARLYDSVIAAAVPRALVAELLADDDPAVRSFAVDVAACLPDPPVMALVHCLTVDEPENGSAAKHAAELLLTLVKEADGAWPGESVHELAEWLVPRLTDGEISTASKVFEMLTKLTRIDEGQIAKTVLEAEQPSWAFVEAINTLDAVDAPARWKGKMAARELLITGEEFRQVRGSDRDPCLEYIDAIPIEELRRVAIDGEGHRGTQKPVDLLVLIATGRDDEHYHNPPWATGESPRDQTADPSPERAQAAREAIVDGAVEGENRWAIKALRHVLPPEESRNLLLSLADEEKSDTQRTGALRGLSRVVDVSADGGMAPELEIIVGAMDDEDESLATTATSALWWALVNRDDTDTEVATARATAEPIDSALRSALSADDTTRRRRAASTLDGIAAPNAGQADLLVERVQVESNDDIRLRLVRALGNAVEAGVAGDAAVETLARVSRSDDDARVSAAAIDALAAIRPGAE